MSLFVGALVYLLLRLCVFWYRWEEMKGQRDKEGERRESKKKKNGRKRSWWPPKKEVVQIHSFFHSWSRSLCLAPFQVLGILRSRRGMKFLISQTSEGDFG